MFLNQGGNSKNSRKKLKIWEDFAPSERPSGVIKKPVLVLLTMRIGLLRQFQFYHTEWPNSFKSVSLHYDKKETRISLIIQSKGKVTCNSYVAFWVHSIGIV